MKQTLEDTIINVHKIALLMRTVLVQGTNDHGIVIINNTYLVNNGKMYIHTMYILEYQPRYSDGWDQ